jgi:hypothetical protein
MVASEGSSPVTTCPISSPQASIQSVSQPTTKASDRYLTYRLYCCASRETACPTVGVSFEAHTMEAPVNQDGHIDILTPPGTHGAYLLEQRQPLTSFVVKDGHEDGGVVRLVA